MFPDKWPVFSETSENECHVTRNRAGSTHAGSIPPTDCLSS